MQYDTLNPRLFWIAEHVRRDAVFVDVGTDHAKLPIALIRAGRVARAIASDIGEGPAKVAAARIAEEGLCDAIRVVVCNGLTDLDRFSPTDIAICGMGGETVRGILETADFIRDPRIRLLLQPMTDFALVRRFLASGGFEIVDEDIVSSDGRLYQCLAAEYSGTSYSLSEVEAELGRLNIERRTPTFSAYVRRRRSIVKKCLDGKRRAGADTFTEEALLRGYENILEVDRETE